MRHSLPTFLLALVILSSWAAPAAPVEINNAPALMPGAVSDIDVSVRLIGGKGAVLMPGREINLTFQTSADAYVIIYNIDSEGYVHLLYPSDGRPELVRGKRVQFLPEQGMGTTWEVSGETGIEYIHAVAVSDPSRIDRDELYYLAQNSTMPEDRRLRIDMDPFLAFNMIDEELVEDAERAAPATDYTYFYVNRRVDYPGYLCYKCHSPSKIPDPYAMECPEVDIEMIGLSEDESYPYPQLFAVLQAGETAPEDEYDSYEYYTDNLSLGYEDYEYDESKVYLSVYYTSSWYPYNYYWPGYWPSYSYWNPGFYWGFSWGWGWNWGGGYYCHHYPFNSWYGYHSYPWYGGYYGYGSYAYWNGYNHGWYDGYWYGGGGYYDGRYVNNRGSIYARRDFTKRRSLDYASTRVKTSRDATMASSRLVKERTKRATAASYRKSRLAKQVTRERASTGFRSFETNRYNTGRTSRERRNIYGNYGTTRSARITNEVNRTTRTRTRSDSRSSKSEPTIRSDKGNRKFERKSGTTSTRRGTTNTNRTHTGSELQRRVKERREQRETKARDSGASKRRYTPPTSRKTNTRSNSSRSSKSSKSSARSKRNDSKSDSGRSSTTTRKQSSPSRSSTSQSSTRSTTRSSGSRSSTTRSSGSRSSGSRSSGSRSTGRKK